MFGINLSLATTKREFMHLRAGWQQLQHSISPLSTVFQTWEWCYSWWSAFAHHYNALVVLYATIGDEITALAPLALQSSTSTNEGKVEAILLGAGEADYLDCLVKPMVSVFFVEALLHSLRQMSVNTLILTDIPRWSSFAEAITIVAKRYGLRLISGTSETCPFVNLPMQWSDYLTSKTRNMREQIRRTRRKLAQQGITFHVCDEQVELSRYQTGFLELNHRWWKGKDTESVLSNTENQDFFFEVTERLFTEHMLHLSLQRNCDVLVSSFITFAYEDVLYYYLSGINPDFATYSPGFGHLSFIVEDAILQNFRRLDLLRGEEAYKHRWSNGVNHTFWYQLEI